MVATAEPDTTATTPMGPISWVLTPTDLAHLLAAISTATLCVLDTETTGLHARAVHGGPLNRGIPARLVMATLTLIQPDEGGEPTTYVLPLSHPDGPWSGRWRSVITQVACALADEAVLLVGHNIKYDCRWLHAHTDVDLAHLIVWDTQISAHLLDETLSTKLKDRAPATFGITRWDDEVDLTIPGAAERTDIYVLAEYAARDTYWTWRLYVRHRAEMYLHSGADDEPPLTPEEVADAHLGRLSLLVAMPMVATLTEIEQRGIALDVEWTREQLAQRSAAARTGLDEMAARYLLDPERASAAATSKWFIEFTEAAVRAGELQIAALTPNGNPQWSKSVLLRQAHSGSQAAQLVLDVRRDVKAAEYLSSWLEFLSPAGRIHTTYHAGRVVTGRLCVTADTLIDMPRDMVKYPDGVPITEVRVGDWVYAFDHRRELTLRQVEWVGQTGVKPTVVVTMRNSHGHERVLRCTPDHLVRLRSGDYRHAERLRVGDTVMPMVRRGLHEDGKGGYFTFFPHSIARGNGQRSGGKNKEHRWVLEQIAGRRISTKIDVHHVNGTKVDNTPSNLLSLTMGEHRSLHKRGHARWGEERETPATYTGPNDYRVVSVEQGEVEPVWDMTVPEDHCFVANGIVVHNSSSDPNMQQCAKVLRPAFMPDPGYVIADLDFSQIELRVAAFISRCEPMLAAYQRGDDLHRLLASQIAEVPLADVTPAQRQMAKAAGFGLVYGMSAEGFREYAETAYDVVLTVEEAEAVRQTYFATWDGLSDWHARTIARAKRDGWVVSPIGRVRRLPDIWDPNRKISSFAERRAINAPVQGFASDMMQIAAASIAGRLPGHARVIGAQLLGTVHDSIVIQVPADRWQEVVAACVDRMEHAVQPVLERLRCRLDVPLVADATCGTRWGLDDVSGG